MFINYDDKNLLTWFVIRDDDFETEKNIHLASAKVNMSYYDFGYSITNSISENSDNIEVPEHYKNINRIVN